MNFKKQNRDLRLIFFFLVIIIFSSLAKAVSYSAEISVPTEYEHVLPGRDLIASIKVIDVDNQGRVDTQIEYEIKNAEKMSILKKTETVAIETQATFLRTFTIPDNTPSGTYDLSATIFYNDKKAVAHTTFQIGKNSNQKFLLYFLMLF